MQDDKLKELIQAVLDGKQLQWDYFTPDNEAGWKSYLDNRATCYRIQRLCEDFNNYAFRIKPEVKTFKYKTRPYSYIDSHSEKYGVWVSSEQHYSQEYLESWGSGLGFKWLAPATEHEVEYE